MTPMEYPVPPRKGLERRTPLRRTPFRQPRSAPLPRGGARLRPFSRRRINDRERRRALVARRLLQAGNRCQGSAYGVEHDCAGPLDVHEIVPRSAWAAGYLVDENTVVVCRSLHDWIGDHPNEAHDHGLHRYSWERTD